MPPMLGISFPSAHRYTLRPWAGCPLWQLVTYRLKLASLRTVSVALVKPAQAHITVHSFYVLTRPVLTPMSPVSLLGCRVPRSGLLILMVTGSAKLPFLNVIRSPVSLRVVQRVATVPAQQHVFIGSFVLI